MGEGGQPSQSVCFWMPPQFIRRFDRNALPVALQLVRQRLAEQIRRQIELSNQFQLG
jgi:hypothetical protein